MDDRASAPPPRVCLCILMNHPYPRNLPLLREIYLGKFSHVRFLIPFERMEDADVITVYRGSYNHAGYITDAREALQALDCEYYVVCHDDVLLNPRFAEKTFREFFPIGPDDAFIPSTSPLPDHIGGWSWYFGLVPKLFHPKSLIFGTGVEPAFLSRYLPDPALAERKLRDSGVVYASEVRLSGPLSEEVTERPSKVVLDGHYNPIDPNDPRQVEMEALSLDICRNLARTLELSADMAGREHRTAEGDPAVALPLPLANAGFFTDFYILPASRLADYAHYVGVAAAANLFVEVMAPTLLLICCERVWRADQLGLDISGFYRQPGVEAFEDSRFLAIHPFKMARMDGADKRALLVKLRAIAGEANPRLPVASLGGGEGGLFDIDGAEATGWHGPELLAEWSAEPVATVSFHVDGRVPLQGLRVRLQLPTHPTLGPLSGSVALNGEVRPISAAWPHAQVEVDFHARCFRIDQRNVIEVRADTFVRPSDVQPESSQDHRLIGVGLRGLRFY